MLIDSVAELVKVQLLDYEGSHDWWHVKRVWQTAKNIWEQEGGDLPLVELAALLHDVDDYKYRHEGDVEGKKTEQILKQAGAEDQLIQRVLEVVKQVSFKGEGHDDKVASLEAAIVQDADRLDAMGAIGIARTFAYGGAKDRALYIPGIEPVSGMKKDDYMGNTHPTINHFFEKLLLLKDRMKTATGKQLAEDRHAYMVEYVRRFFEEVGEDLPLEFRDFL